MTTNGIIYPSSFLLMAAMEEEEAYRLALIFVDAIEPRPGDNRLARKFYNKRGELLLRLDEVVRAILADDLLLPEDNEPTVLAFPAELARAA